MPTTKPRFTMTISEEMDERITHFWHENQIRSKNIAIKQLIDIGLKAFGGGRVVYTPQQERRPEYEPSEEGLSVAKRFDGLDGDYQRAVKSMMRTLSAEQQLRADNQDAGSQE